MPCISGQYDPSIGVILQVSVVPGGTLQRSLDQMVRSGEEGGNVQAFAANGLMDTGADSTCISPQIVGSLGLQPNGKVAVSGSTGSSPMNQYMVDLLLQFGQNSIFYENRMVVEYASSSPHHNMLIGRDIICSGVFSMDFGGHFSFAV